MCKNAVLYPSSDFFGCKNIKIVLHFFLFLHFDNFVSIFSKKYIYMSDKQKDSKKLAILKAAQEEFVTKGYDGARTMEIAEKAGIGHSLLHYHFKTKKELFKCVVQQKMDLLRQAILVSWTDSGNGLLEKLSEIIGKHFDFVMENADYLRFQFQEMERHPELFEEIKAAVQAGLRQLSSALQEELDRTAAEGSIIQTDAQMLLEDILALNLFFHLAAPTLHKIECQKCDKKYYEKRKMENIALILNRLTPTPNH